MRLAPPFKASASALLALASLAGCGDDPITPPSDAATSDVPMVDNGMPVDNGTPTDTTFVDVPVTLDAADVVTPPPTDVGPDDGFSPGSCGVSAAVRTHATQMATMGWSALNRTNGMLMHGCTAGQAAGDCLAMVPIVGDSSIGANRSALPSQHLRLLYTASTSSNYWTRISADGRFVGRGTHVHDLVRDVEIETAPVAQYDSAFFPDGSRFMFQPGARTCPMSVLTMGNPTMLTLSEAGCSRGTVGLYEHLAVSLGGGDYWATSAGAAAFDDGGHARTLRDPPPNSPWRANAATSLTLMANTGSTFATVATISIVLPNQGDAVISPSTRLLMTRFSDSSGTNPMGYVLHRLDAVRMGSAVTANTTEIARYCIPGAKPAFSLDERWVTYHHYVTRDDAMDLGFTGPDDPAFAPYLTDGAANIYLLDLTTGRRTRLTTMGPRQYALFPSFRSDGWLYFTVRTVGMRAEHVIASDAAIVLR